MLVPIREYASAAEMLSSIAAIRRVFRTDVPTVFPMRIVPEDVVDVGPHPAEPIREPIPTIDWHQHTPLTVEDVLRAVSCAWGIDRIHILSTIRTHDFMIPRLVVYALCCRLTRASLSRIGKAMGRDHSTVVSGRDKMRAKVAAVDASIRSGATALEWAQEMRKEMDEPLSKTDASKAINTQCPS